jgi:hypothetical protein
MAVALTDHQLGILCDAARPLPLHKRDEFLRLVAQALQTRDVDVQSACECAALAVLDTPIDVH